MKFLSGVIFLLSAFVLNDAAVPSAITLKRVSADQMLMQQLMNARASNPSFVAVCFDQYLPIFDEILQEFSYSYQLCSTNADKENSVLDDEAAANRTLISTSSQDVCNSMIDCSALDSSLPFFDCYSDIGDGNIKSLYTLTNIATDVAANLREEYRIIQINLEKCQNASERTYVQSTADAHDALNFCLENGPPPEVSTTTTGAPPTPTADTTRVDGTTQVSADALSDERLVEDLSPAVNLSTQRRVLGKYKSLVGSRKR